VGYGTIMPWSFEACSPTLNAALGNICNRFSLCFYLAAATAGK